jgi:hypothetical protein
MIRKTEILREEKDDIKRRVNSWWVKQKELEGHPSCPDGSVERVTFNSWNRLISTLAVH